MSSSPYGGRRHHNRHQPCWSPKTIRQRSRHNLYQLPPIPMNTTGNDLPFNQQPPTAATAGVQAIQVTTNQFQQLKVHADDVPAAARTSTPHPSRRASTQPSGKTTRFERFSSDFDDKSMAENILLGRLKQVIHEFMVRPGGPRFGYKTTMTWTTDCENEIPYNVVISIDQPCEYV